MLFSAMLALPLYAQVADRADAKQGAEELSIEQADQLFADAMDALEDERLRTARQRFQLILNHYPGLHRARLELARTYYLSLDYEQARAEIEQVLQDPNTPPDVRVTLLAFLAQIDKDQQGLNKAHRWAGSLYAGLVYDSNVNIGPDQQFIELDGTTLSLSSDSVERNDLGAALNIGITHNYSPGVTFSLGERSGFFLWQSQASARYRRFFDETEYNLGVLTLRTGPTWVVPRDWRAAVALQLDQIWLGADRLALFTSLNPSLVKQLGKRWEFQAEAVVTRRDYDAAENKPRDGTRSAFTLAATRYFDALQFSAQAGVGFAHFSADADRFSHSGPELFAAVSASPWEHGSVYARLAWRDFEFDGVEPLFNRQRDDSEWQLTAGFQHELNWAWLAEWELRGRVTLTDNQSNVEIFDYQREQISIGIARTF